MKSSKTSAYISFCALLVLFVTSCKNKAIENSQAENGFSVRERILINQDWHFVKYGSMGEADHHLKRKNYHKRMLTGILKQMKKEDFRMND